jgi:glutamine cyclotransferase
VSPKDPSVREAEVAREYGPYAGAEPVRGVTFDGQSVWFAAGDGIRSFDPTTGREGRKLPVRGDAGTAFDGKHIYQIAGGQIVRVDPATGEVLGSMAAPTTGGHAGLTWAEGSLWLGLHRERKILQIDPETGRVLRTLETPRFVTGVTFAEGDLWYGTMEGGESDLRRADPASGEVLETIAMPTGTFVTGLEYDGRGTLYCGGGGSGKIRAVRRPNKR